MADHPIALLTRHHGILVTDAPIPCESCRDSCFCDGTGACPPLGINAVDVDIFDERPVMFNEGVKICAK